MMGRAVYKIAWPSIFSTTSQRSICATIQTKYCVFILEKSYNTKHLLTPTKKQIPSLNDPPPSLVDFWGVGLALEVHSLHLYS